jgi:PIN domain nuclease of toxin-antitoxin system
MPKSTGKVVLDASALLTVLRNEPGAERVAPHLGRSIMSAVNVAEVATILGRWGMSASSVLADVCKIVGEIRPFDMEQARLSAALDEKTRSLGLSLGDRACLALGVMTGFPVLTADGAWAKVDLNVTIEVVGGSSSPS